jgi:hypothetical protein
MAPLLDSGAESEATIRRLWETPENHQIVPILAVTIRRGASNAAPVQPLPRQRRSRATREAGNRTGCCGCATAAVCLVVLLALCLAAFAMR